MPPASARPTSNSSPTAATTRAAPEPVDSPAPRRIRRAYLPYLTTSYGVANSRDVPRTAIQLDYSIADSACSISSSARFGQHRPHASIGACRRSRTNADDCLPVDPLGLIEGGDGVIKRRD